MALASLGRVGRQAGPATSKSEDKDTWRGPGMLMANSTPTIRHVYLSAYTQNVKFVLESWQKDSFCLFQPEQHLTPTLSLQYKKSLQSCVQNGSGVLRGRNVGREYQVRFPNPLASEN